MRRRRLASLAAALLALGLILVPANAGAAQAADPLRLAVDATYTVDPDAGRVEVSLAVAATNLKAPTATTVFFYPEIVLGVQRTAARIRAADSAGDLTTVTRQRNAYTSVRIVLRSSLLYQQTTRFVVRYDLPGGEPRSDSRIRVGAAFATFDVWAWGDGSRSSVEVRLPPGFESEVIGDSLSVTKDEAGWRLRAEPADPYGFYAIVDAENASAYRRTRVSFEGGVELVILAWPEDAEWQTTVATTLQSGMPVLRELIGLDWPVGHDLEVRERYTPALEGYAGVFYSDESIDVSEDLDPLVIVHEASHAWFDERLFSGRWIYEGLAQEYAWRVVARIDDGGPPPDRPAPDDPGAVALTQWSHPGVIRDQETDAAERYGYAASWWVVHEIVAVVGEERMRLAFERAMNDTTAYLGAGPPEHHPGADGFARLYDLVEDVTAPPSPRIDAAFRTYVMTPAQAPLLDDRSEARTAYRGLLAAGDGWLPPWYVRRPMDEWQFTVAQDRIAEATIVLELRDQVVAEAAGLGLEPDAGLRSAYETTGTGFGAATELARAEIAALDEIDEARQRLEAERDLLTTIGLLDADPEGPYEAARAAFEAGNLDLAVGLAASSVAAIAGAAAIGQQRLLGGVAVTAAVLLLLVVLLVWRRRARRGRTAARAAVAALTGDPAPAGREAYATLAADRADRSEPPAAAALDGGAGQGETPGEQ